jgi:hypothetical protein
MRSGAIAIAATAVAVLASPALAFGSDTARPASSDDATPPMSDDAMSHLLRAALGPYAVTREASGTSWQPDASLHAGLHAMAGDWMLMGHALLNGVYDRQAGPRGADATFLSGMFMGVARREVGAADVIQLRAMLSPDPLMGRSGYPLLLQTGETADGHTPLVDRQHPHDLFMELSGSYAHGLTEHGSVFVYAGLPGEPAFGPPAFMHRLSVEDSPEAPISHHWLDSTHLVFGVVTAGYVREAWKLEVSRFRGREPDQFRYNIETGPLDSTAARLSWNPTETTALQVSWADVTSPEQLQPDKNQRKWSASALYTRPLGEAGWWSTTLAWGHHSAAGAGLDAYAIETALKPAPRWTAFIRAERVDNNELAPGAGGHEPAYVVAKASFGLIRDFPVASNVKVGVGALYAFNFVPVALAALYGGKTPTGTMVFVRLKVE